MLISCIRDRDAEWQLEFTLRTTLAQTTTFPKIHKNSAFCNSREETVQVWVSLLLFIISKVSSLVLGKFQGFSCKSILLLFNICKIVTKALSKLSRIESWLCNDLKIDLPVASQDAKLLANPEPTALVGIATKCYKLIRFQYAVRRYRANFATDCYDTCTDRYG